MAKPKKNTQAWAITYADMVTLLLTFFVLLMVILSEAEKQIEYQISKLLDNAYDQMVEGLDDKNIDVERVTKGVKVSIRGKLFEQLSPDISSEYLSKIARIGDLIKDTDLMKLNLTALPDSSDENFALMSELHDRGQELAVEIRCEGHTDDVPIPEDKKIKYKDNWELSSDRSLNVVKQMNRYASIDYEYFSALGYGPYRPIVSVETIRSKKTRREKDRLREYNRRVEIYLDAFARDKIQTDEGQLIESLSGKKRKKREVEPVEKS